MKYYVEQIYNYGGEASAQVYSEAEIKNNPALANYLTASPEDSYYEKHETYDLYVDVYETKAEAVNFAKKVEARFAIKP